MNLPLSLYIHMPWCVKKCPYCDFNSHKSPDSIPEKAYVQALITDLKSDIAENLVNATRVINSIFIGGGTPSLFSSESYKLLFDELRKLLIFSPEIEITMEANPGAIDIKNFSGYKESGINRLSLGVQSFNDEQLKKLGRIHNSKDVHFAIESAQKAGFENINIDIMHSLPNQSIEEGLKDLKTALSYEPKHLSWYQLTIEPNTVFYKRPPRLPKEDITLILEKEGLALLENCDLRRYEISAFGKINHYSKHNLNYWLFGDYYGIGAGAHGKLTKDNYEICRTQKHRHPSEYMKNPEPQTKILTTADIVFEFMLNTSRLEQEIPNILFSERTGLDFSYLEEKLSLATAKEFISKNKNSWQITPFGRRFTNDLQLLFL